MSEEGTGKGDAEEAEVGRLGPGVLVVPQGMHRQVWPVHLYLWNWMNGGWYASAWRGLWIEV